MIKNQRLQALHILQKVLGKKVKLDLAIAESVDNSSTSRVTPTCRGLSAASMDPADKPRDVGLKRDDITSPFTKAIVYGVCRHYFRLECLVDRLIPKRPKDLELWLVLLMGLYQLQFLDKPEFATVKETVALLDSLKKTWAKGLVNAVFRRFCRERQELLAKVREDPNFILGHPNWFICKMQQDWPDAWPAILKANDEHPPMSLRVNAKYCSREAYLQRLEALGIKALPQQYSAVGLNLVEPLAISELPGFEAGEVSIQDEAAQLAIPLLALEPNCSVLDMCTAPGGKLCHMLETDPTLQCLAVDKEKKRHPRVLENLARLGLEAKVITGDGLAPATWWDGHLFDRILLDVPCSATGVIRRHPDIKLQRSYADIQTLTKLQANFLASVWPMLKPGGIMVYATCSVLKEENEAQIASFIQNHPDCLCDKTDKPWGRNTGFGWQLLPGDSNTDGFFYSVLCKT